MKKTAVAAVCFIILISCHALSNNFCLQFSIFSGNEDPNISPDTFFAVGSSNPLVTAGYDINDLLAAPSPPGKYFRMYSTDSGVKLIKDYRPFDPNLPDLLFPIQLLIRDTNSAGFTGTVQLNLVNPSALSSIPSDTLVYLRRNNASDVFEQYYNLRDPNNHSIEWQITDANGVFAKLDLVIKDKCLASDLNGSGMVEFKDIAKLALFWQSNVPSGSKDINGNSFADTEDIAILAEKWLCVCQPD